MHMLLLVAVCLLVPSAMAADPDAPPARTDAAAPKTESLPPPVTCVEDTGSRIKRRPGECQPAAGRVHHAEDLESTGATSVGDALRQLDPALR